MSLYKFRINLFLIEREKERQELTGEEKVKVLSRKN